MKIENNNFNPLDTRQREWKTIISIIKLRTRLNRINTDDIQFGDAETLGNSDNQRCVCDV